MCGECRKLIESIDAYIAKADNKLSDALKNAGFMASKETVKRMEQLEDKIAEVLKEQSLSAEELIKMAAEAGIEIDEFIDTSWQDFKKADDIKEKLFPIFLKEFSESIPEFANIYMAQMDSELVVDQISESTSNWIAQWSDELAELMKLSAHEEIESVLTDALKRGKSVAQLSRDIMNGGIRDEYYKARRVSITEMLRAHSAAREESIQQSPAVESKEWVHTGSYRNKPRRNHQKISGQIVPKNMPFTLVGADGVTYHPQYPRAVTLPPGESVNCHCIHRGIVSEKVLGLSLEERKALQQKAIEEMGDEWEKELNAQNKAKAGINEDTIKCDWLKNKKTVSERKAYFRSDSRWALFESGVIENDSDLERLYKTVETPNGKRKIFKSLTELRDDGIITVSKARMEHSSLGDWTKTQRLDGGGHGQRGMEKLLSAGVKPVIYKEYSNGVRIGSVPYHKNPNKKTGSKKANSDIGQSWFPESWDDDRIMLAGTYTANKGIGNGITKTAVYDNVEIVVFVNDGDIGTICPNNTKQPEGGGWEYARD